GTSCEKIDNYRPMYQSTGQIKCTPALSVGQFSENLLTPIPYSLWENAIITNKCTPNIGRRIDELVHVESIGSMTQRHTDAFVKGDRWGLSSVRWVLQTSTELFVPFLLQRCYPFLIISWSLVDASSPTSAPTKSLTEAPTTSRFHQRIPPRSLRRIRPNRR